MLNEKQFGYICQRLEDCWSSEWFGGIRRFDKATLEDLEMIEINKALDKSERQNDGPTIGQLMQFAIDFKVNSQILFEGYVVSNARSDCRFTVNAVYVPIESELVAALRNLKPNEESEEYDKTMIRFWWD